MAEPWKICFPSSSSLSPGHTQMHTYTCVCVHTQTHTLTLEAPWGLIDSSQRTVPMNQPFLEGGDSWTGSQRTGRGHHAGRRWAGQPPRLGDGDAVNPRPPCVRVRTAGLGGTLLGTWARVLPRCGRVDGPRQGSGPPPAGATREPLRFFGLKDRGSAAHLPSLDSGVPPCPRTGRDHCREPEGQPGPASQHQSMQNPHAFSRCQV